MRRVDHDRHRTVVLRARSDHRRATDVDLLDDLRRSRPARDRLDERVQVGDQELERDDAELVDGGHVVRVVLIGEQAPWIDGADVLTRPPMISGNPVTSSTAVTGTPSSRIRAAVEPVETISTPASCRPRASSSSPVLS